MSVNFIQSVILGIVQGLSEFLPISSTAHLVLVPYFFNWEDPGLAFDVALHVGTLIAVLAYFYSDWIAILKSAFSSDIHVTDRKQVYNQKMLGFLVIATVPGVLAGYYLSDLAETAFRHPLVVAFMLAFFGLLLYLADKFIQHKKDIKLVSLTDSIVIGITQAIAVIPGVSRSGITMTAGLMQGLDRVSAARFSFLLSTPIIFGAAVLKVPYLFSKGLDFLLITGIFTAAVSGYLAIKYLIKFVARASYRIFFWYRLALAVIIVLVYILVNN